MAETWYDSGGVPREEWGAKPEALTPADIKAAEQGAQNYFRQLDKERDARNEVRRTAVMNSAITYEDRLAAIKRVEDAEAINFENQVQKYEMERKAREEAKRHREAVALARQRYEEKGSLYKLFHRKLTTKKATTMTADEINNLYGGVEESRGKSR